MLRSLTRAPALRAEDAEDGVFGFVVGVGHVALPRLRASAEMQSLDGDGNLVGGDDVAAQARATLENIGAILEAAGATFADVLKVIVYLTDIGDRAAINPVRQEFFGDSRPCSTLIGINELVVPGMKVEIEAIASLSS